VATPVDVARVEDVTAEHLGSASLFEVAVFQSAVIEYLLAEAVTLRAALTAIWAAGAWREVVAERCPVQWTIAQRLTAEERERRPLTPGSHPGYGVSANPGRRGV
jgi:hypothetical protein